MPHACRGRRAFSSRLRATALALLALGSTAASTAAAPPHLPDFYAPVKPARADPPGTLLEHERVPARRSGTSSPRPGDDSFPDSSGRASTASLAPATTFPAPSR